MIIIVLSVIQNVDSTISRVEILGENIVSRTAAARRIGHRQTNWNTRRKVYVDITSAET